jgi:hypothetical protein
MQDSGNFKSESSGEDEPPQTRSQTLSLIHRYESHRSSTRHRLRSLLNTSSSTPFTPLEIKKLTKGYQKEIDEMDGALDYLYRVLQDSNEAYHFETKASRLKKINKHVKIVSWAAEIRKEENESSVPRKPRKRWSFPLTSFSQQETTKMTRKKRAQPHPPPIDFWNYMNRWNTFII